MELLRDQVDGNKLMVDQCFGWAPELYSRSLFKVLEFGSKSNDCQRKKILEIGCGAHSIASVIFDSNEAEVTLGYYGIDRALVEDKLSQIKNQFELRGSYSFEEIDCNDFNGQWDLIFMKSVLGGVYRTNRDTVGLSRCVGRIVENNLAPGGILISLDNGIGFRKYFPKTSSRISKGWWFFTFDELPTQYLLNRVGIGYLAVCSFRRRIPLLGLLLDRLLFFLDVLIGFVTIRNFAVIASIYGKPHG